MSQQPGQGWETQPLQQVERRQIALISLAAFALRAALGLRSEFLLATGPYIDDSFYAFSCAMHVARGHGFSVDGVHATNGVQPLICVLYAPFFFFTSDKWLALRSSFILQGVIVAAGCWFIAQLVASVRRDESNRAPVIAAAIWGLSISCFYQNTNGLETGLTAALLMACVLISPSRLVSFKSSIGFGVLLGVAVLARIDSAFLVVVFALFDLVRTRLKETARVAAYAFTALVVSLPWWIYNIAAFHSLMPMSGQSESLSRPYATNVVWLANALIDQLSLFYYHLYALWDRELTAIALLGLAIGWAALFRVKIARMANVDYAALMPLAIFCVVLLIYYTLFFSAPYFIDRYLTPLRILLIILFSLRVGAFMASRTQWRRAVQFSGVAIALFCSFGFYRQFIRPTLWEDFYSVGQWAETQPVRIGMFQSGLTSFMTPNILNLDGKVNAEALHARKENRLAEYLIASNCTYLADWPDDVRPLALRTAELGVHFDSVRTVGSVLIYQRRD